MKSLDCPIREDCGKRCMPELFAEPTLSSPKKSCTLFPYLFCKLEIVSVSGGENRLVGHVMATAAQVTPSMSDVVGRERLGWPTTGLNKTNDSENQFPNYIYTYT